MYEYVLFIVGLSVIISASGYYFKKSKQTAKMVGCFWLAFIFDWIYERGEFSFKIFLFWIGFMFVVLVADTCANTGIKKEDMGKH